LKTLLIDAGNTRLKWATLDDRHMARRYGAPWTPGTLDAITSRAVSVAQGLQRIVVCSVAGKVVDAAICKAAAGCGAPEPEFLKSVRKQCGVRNAYREPEHLGVDRWISLLAAHQQFPHVNVCIVAIGTAITVDVLAANGLHGGGWIIPGPRLMVDSLLHRTALIQQNAAEVRGRLTSSLFARDTRGAIEIGSLQASVAMVVYALRCTQRLLGSPVTLVLCGGGAPALVSALPGELPQNQIVEFKQHLVLEGIELLAKQSKR
jgi:type III pantothenate kinase